MSRITFSHLLTIYRASEFAPDGENATTKIADEKVRDALRLALSDENIDDAGITVHDDPDDIKVGGVKRINVQTPKISLGYLASGFDKFLGMRRVTFVEPKNFYLIREKFAKADLAPPFAVERYRKVIELIALLEKCAAYLDKDRGELVFIKDGKFSIPLAYTPGELAAVDIDSVIKILDQFSGKDDAHQEQKRAILASTVLGMLEGVANGVRFRALLLELPELSRKFLDGYKLYLANFSYDKVHDELQAFKVDYTSKIHKAFSDIQSQLLTVPVATIVVATQLKLVQEGDQAVMLTNVAVLIGCWVFAALFALLCVNQFRTLQVLEAEVARQESKMKANYETVLEMFKGIFDSLRNRVSDQKCILWVVGSVVLAGLAVANWFFWQFTKGYFHP